VPRGCKKKRRRSRHLDPRLERGHGQPARARRPEGPPRGFSRRVRASDLEGYALGTARGRKAPRPRHFSCSGDVEVGQGAKFHRGTLVSSRAATGVVEPRPAGPGSASPVESRASFVEAPPRALGRRPTPRVAPPGTRRETNFPSGTSCSLVLRPAASLPPRGHPPSCVYVRGIVGRHRAEKAPRRTFFFSKSPKCLRVLIQRVFRVGSQLVYGLIGRLSRPCQGRVLWDGGRRVLGDGPPCEYLEETRSVRMSRSAGFPASIQNAHLLGDCTSGFYKTGFPIWKVTARH
jgi:hypothetical protein